MSAEPKPCPEYANCDRPLVWRVTSPADLFHTDPINIVQPHASALTCDHHLGGTAAWARGIAGNPEVVPLLQRTSGGAV